ncbi:MAG: ABC transporter permease [Nitrospiraceae bacterium]|nr:MAG: ABC transporter permease [Nitrospiraceae bacterium]
MRIFLYSVETSLKSLWREKWINLLTVLSISIGLLIISAFATITHNLDSVLKRWSRDFGLVVYLNDGLSKEAEDTLTAFFRHDADISGIKYISKEQALEELRLTLGEQSPVLEGFEDNPLPSSFELTLKQERLDPVFVQRKASEIKRLNGVEEVQYGEKWLSSLNALANIMKVSVVFLGGAVFIAIAFITYSTIKIFFYRRKDEIETLKLLGATRSFIRLPFLLEGLFIGIMAGAVSALGLFGVYSLVMSKVAGFLPSINIVMVPLPLKAYMPAPLAGALMSFLGSFVAVGTIKY